MGFFFSPSFVVLSMCFVSSSCWKTIFSVLAEGRRFLSEILHYMDPSIGTSMRWSRPQSLTFPPPCMDHVLWIILSTSLPSNTPGWVNVKELDFGFIWPHHFLPSLLWIINMFTGKVLYLHSCGRSINLSLTSSDSSMVLPMVVKRFICNRLVDWLSSVHHMGTQLEFWLVCRGLNPYFTQWHINQFITAMCFFWILGWYFVS